MHIENMEDDKGKNLVVTEGKSSSHERLVEVRVLVLEHDDRYLSTLETMLKSFGYSVSTCPRATEALLLLEEDKSGYDMVISDAHLADMDGFKFLQKVGLEMNLSVVLILLEKKRGSILKGSVHGACGYVIKHITSDSLGHIREQMLLKDKDDLRVLLVGDAEFRETNLSSDDHGQETLPAIKEEDVKNSPTLKRIKDEEDHEVHEALYDGIKAKKPRLIWTEELCRVFEIAVEKLGEKAVPKKILDVMENMGVSNLTRENVASHLQKYRMRNKKRTNQNQTKHLLGLPAITNFEQSNKSEEEIKFQFCISPNQLPFRSITLESNSHVAPLPCQRNMNPSNSSQVMASNYYKMARQIGDDGAPGYCTPAVANLQPNRTLEYFSNTHDQSCQVNEIAASRQMIGGAEDEYLPFGYEIENFGNTASKETNNAVMSQPLTMSGQYGFPLQDASDPLNCTISGNDYVSLGNNAPPYYNEPSVGNAFYPNFGSG